MTNTTSDDGEYEKKPMMMLTIKATRLKKRICSYDGDTIVCIQRAII